MRPQDDFKETTDLLSRRDATSRRQLLGEIFEHHRDRLRRMVVRRLHAALQGRVGPSDVLQEVFIEAARRLESYLREPDVPLFIWLRFLTCQKIVDFHRYHLGAKRRDPRREVSLQRGLVPHASSASLAMEALASNRSPSEAAMRAEHLRRLEKALDAMDPLDREVLALRHFEGLTSSETARVLGIKERAASKRYLRALQRLRSILKRLS